MVALGFQHSDILIVDSRGDEAAWLGESLGGWWAWCASTWEEA